MFGVSHQRLTTWVKVFDGHFLMDDITVYWSWTCCEVTCTESQATGTITKEEKAQGPNNRGLGSRRKGRRMKEWEQSEKQKNKEGGWHDGCTFIEHVEFLGKQKHTDIKYDSHESLGTGSCFPSQLVPFSFCVCVSIFHKSKSETVNVLFSGNFFEISARISSSLLSGLPLPRETLPSSTRSNEIHVGCGVSMPAAACGAAHTWRL